MFLLDTSVVAELRKPKPHGGVLAWVNALRPDELNIPAVVVGEVAAGIAKERLRDPMRAADLQAWLDALERDFPILSADAPIFRVWGQLMYRGQKHLFVDALIAATAIHHGLTVATRNVDDFAPFGVLVANPFGRGR
ncbi:MAG: type II toxin-antitoxin system VapC family toxin [Alphaproteobacteria bacterium]|nr:type II toxin-antitoxin system VapC family toxin [Alphaproteobacteria bacterium]